MWKRWIWVLNALCLLTGAESLALKRTDFPGAVLKKLMAEAKRPTSGLGKAKAEPATMKPSQIKAKSLAGDAYVPFSKTWSAKVPMKGGVGWARGTAVLKRGRSLRYVVRVTEVRRPGAGSKR